VSHWDGSRENWVFFFFGGTGDCTQDLVLARQVLYHMNHVPQPSLGKIGKGKLNPPLKVYTVIWQIKKIYIYISY
jgi:hypothetical protein